MRDGGTAHSTPHFLQQRGGEVERNQLPAGLKVTISRVNDGSFPGGRRMENVTQETSWRNLSHPEFSSACGRTVIGKRKNISD